MHLVFVLSRLLQNIWMSTAPPVPRETSLQSSLAQIPVRTARVRPFTTYAQSLRSSSVRRAALGYGVPRKCLLPQPAQPSQKRDESTASTTQKPRIAIAGAGPAGLVLARMLQIHHFDCTVFELDKDRQARTEGGSLDLHNGAGQRVLKEAGLFEHFMQHARPEGDELRIYDPYDNVLLDESRDDEKGRPGEMRGRPEINRALLRSLLLDSLETGTVSWEHKLTKVQPTGVRSCTVEFCNGATMVFDLVVGADGTWSKVRPAVVGQVPYFSGITGIDIRISDPDRRHPALPERVGKGMCLTLGQDKGILCQRNGDGAIGFMR